jgi:hypothetical protein
MKQQNGKQSLSGKAKVQFAMIFNSAAVLESELPTSVSVSTHSYGFAKKSYSVSDAKAQRFGM